MESLLRNQSDWTTLTTLGSLALLLLWEARAPLRAVGADRNTRWRVNIVLMVIGTVLVSWLIPLSLTGWALQVQARGWGMFHWLDAPGWLAFAGSMMMMDAVKYLQHFAMHRVPMLWRVHRTHHCDPDLDVTTSVRFHPFELMISLVVDAALIALLGAPVTAVLLYRLLRTMVSSFVHGNVRLPPGLERMLRLAVATPDFHRLHHSTVLAEQGSNLSGGLTCWDRLFATYRSTAQGDPRTMPLGDAHCDAARAASVKAMLLDPLL